MQPSAPDRETPPVSGPADAPPGNWVDRFAPRTAVPYLQLARADRPIGSWLLLFPCWWSLTLAELDSGRLFPSPLALMLFAIGAFAMRGAGCAYNDWVDRDFDARVARTASRPIPSGRVSPSAALIFAAALSLIGLFVVLTFNRFTIALAVASLLLVVIYPFMKRFTYWPQLFLGLAFNWGALVGWASAEGSLATAPLALYAGCVAWTIGYDTIYAHQDAADDLRLGLKSTAIRFGSATRSWVGGFYAGALMLWASAGYLAGAGPVSLLGLGLAGLHLAWQVITLDVNDAANCLTRFRSNRDVGAIFFLTLLADMAIRSYLT